jgi:hypothetical protein
MMRFASNEKSGLAVAEHLRAGHAAKGAQRGEEIYSLEDIGFSLRVVPQKQMKARPELDVEPGVIPKVS